MTFKIVSACLLVHTQPRKGFSGPSETQERERKKKKQEKKIQEKKNCNSVSFFIVFFLKERFTDTGGWTTLMPQRKMDFKSRASSHTSYLGCCCIVCRALIPTAESGRNSGNVTSIKGVSVVFYTKKCTISRGDVLSSAELTVLRYPIQCFLQSLFDFFSYTFFFTKLVLNVLPRLLLCGLCASVVIELQLVC